MRKLHHIVLLLLAALPVLLSSCGDDYRRDIDLLNEQHSSIEKRVSNLETQVSQMNTQLGQLSVLANAAEQGFYVTAVKTTDNGYELTLSNGSIIVLQNGANKTLVPMPSINMTQLSGFYYWTLNGQLITGDNGQPIRSTGLTPIVKYDYTTQQWVVSIDGGSTFRDVNVIASLVINDTVLLQVINTYISRYKTTLISQEVLYQIISTYIQRNYASLFSVEVLDQVVGNYVNQHYAKLFNYELLEKIFNQYNFEYYTSQIDINELTNLIITFIREHKEVLLNNEVLYEIIRNYIEVNQVTLFDNQLLLEVITNFIQNNENFINVELLTQVINNYIDQHQDVIFNTETVRKLISEYVKKYYTQVFSQEILLQVLNTYVTKNNTTIFNETVIKEVINYYLQNNFNTFISTQVVYDIINNYVTKNASTILNREVLVEVITNYFQKNYNLFIDRTVISQIFNTYIEEHKTTIIDVEVIRQIVYRYIQQNYKEIFSIDLLQQVVFNYFKENQQVLTQYISENAGVVTDVSVDNDQCIISLRNGQSVKLVVYDAMTRLRDRVQSIVILPNDNGFIQSDIWHKYISFSCLVSPAAMGSVIVDKCNKDEMEMELVLTNRDDESIFRVPVYTYSANDGILSISVDASQYELVGAVALHIKENRSGGTDIMTEFLPVEYEGYQRGYLECPDGNHPHMIRLGLPSGTLWSCCNVGADKPESYGNYYAWGETWQKDTYDWNSYQYGSSFGNVTDIGSDIAGTQYDVARQKLGESWQMPTSEQLSELVKYTSSKWMTQGGVYGRKFTGSNGGSLFIPAAGLYYGTKNSSVGNGGYYWSSTNSTERETGIAWVLMFSTSYQYVTGEADMGFRYNGLPVRPVAAP